METIITAEKKGKGITYYHHLDSDKHYFASFLNLAQNNIEQICNEFKLRLNLKQTPSPTEVVINYFANSMSYTDWDKGIKILKDYLPVIEYLDLTITDKQFESIRDDKELAKRNYFINNLKLLFKTVNELRNYYTHFYHPKIKIDENVFKFLDTVLFSVCLEVKKHKMKNDKTKQALKSGLVGEMKILIDLEKKFQKEKGIRTWNKEENIEGAIYNNAFSDFITKNKAEVTILKDYKKSKFLPKSISEEPSIDLSLSGLIFLLSMFLTRKEAEQLKSNIEGFKGKVVGEEYPIDRKKNSLKFMATHWIYSYLSFKGLKQRVKSTFDKETLLMQMIDELSKIPDEVYQTLSDKDKEQFLEDMNQYVQDNVENEKGLEQSTIIHPVIRKRYEDKFNYFAIRFLDEFAQFPTLKFKVYIGNFVHDNRTKNIPGSQITSERLIKEKITIFDKLSTVSKVKSDFFAKPEILETSQWELFPNPNYDFVGNNIPIYIDLHKNGEEASRCQADINILHKTHSEDKIRSNNKPNKDDILHKMFGSKINSKKATAILSFNEIPSLLYELLVNKKSGKEIEQIIADKITQHFNDLKNYSTEQKLSGSFIPKKMRRSSNVDYLNVDKLFNDINNEVKLSEDKLTLIVNNKTELQKGKRKHVFYSSETGIEATWIANDIKRFMPKDAKVKWKGNYHSELQKYIAFYTINKVDALTLLNENWNFDTDSFFGEEIQKAFIKRDFVSFYEEYLKQRKQILIGMSEHIKMWKDEPKILKKGLKDIFRIFDERLYNIKTLPKQKEQLLLKPIHLPRGLFDDNPTFVLGEKVTEKPELFANWYQYSYNEKHLFQRFYDLKGNYKELFEKFKQFDEDALLNKKKLNNEEMFNLFKRKHDLKVKEIKHRDLFIKLMADALFNTIFNQEIDFNLKELYQDVEERYKNQVIANKQKDRITGDTSDNVFNENFIWNKTIPFSLYDGRLVEAKVKLKDIGKFRKLESDEKVKQLLAYDTTKVWTKLAIEDELENKSNSYERIRREKLLKCIQVFELYLLEKENYKISGHPKSFEFEGNPSFKKYIANGVLRKNFSLNDLEINYIENSISYDNDDLIDYEKIAQLSPKVKKAFFLILLRNKFSHNQLPNEKAFVLINEEFTRDETITYAEYYLNLCNYLIGELKK